MIGPLKLLGPCQQNFTIVSFRTSTFKSCKELMSTSNTLTDSKSVETLKTHTQAYIVQTMKRLGGERAWALANTHTPLEGKKSSKNSGEDPSCRPLSASVDVNVEWSLSAPVDVNVEQSPRHIMSVSSSWAWHLNTPPQAQLQLHHSKHAAESRMLLSS
jgi:hypothetical protein